MLPMNEKSSLDFEQKHEKDLHGLRGFRLLDNDFIKERCTGGSEQKNELPENRERIFV